MWILASAVLGSIAMIIATITLMVTGAPFIGHWAMAAGWLVCVGVAMGTLQAIFGCEDRWV
jgi:hypothetical protein